MLDAAQLGQALEFLALLVCVPLAVDQDADDRSGEIQPHATTEQEEAGDTSGKYNDQRRKDGSDGRCPTCEQVANNDDQDEFD